MYEDKREIPKHYALVLLWMLCQSQKQCNECRRRSQVFFDQVQWYLWGKLGCEGAGGGECRRSVCIHSGLGLSKNVLKFRCKILQSVAISAFYINKSVRNQEDKNYNLDTYVNSWCSSTARRHARALHAFWFHTKGTDWPVCQMKDRWSQPSNRLAAEHDRCQLTQQ